MKRFKIWQIALALIAILLLLGVVIFVIWAGVPLPADEQAFTALEVDASISVDTEPWLVFKPQSTEPTAGFTFYPGGRVQPEAYAPAARKFAEMGYLVVIPRMPLNLAFFDAEVANQIMASYPEVGCWVVGGHSLGGAMAARFAHRHPESVDGLVKMAWLKWRAYLQVNHCYHPIPGGCSSREVIMLALVGMGRSPVITHARSVWNPNKNRSYRLMLNC